MRIQPRSGLLFVLPPDCTDAGAKMSLCLCGEAQGPLETWVDAKLCPACRGEYEQDDFLRQDYRKDISNATQ